jgi:hypothetical protein
VRAHDFAGELLCAHACFSQRVDVTPLCLSLFHQLALFGRSLIEQTRERAALVFAFLGELRVRACLLVQLALQLLHVVLMRSLAVSEFRLKPIAVGFGTLQPGAEILKVRPALLEQLLELVLGSEGRLKRFDRGGCFIERPFDDKHPLARVGCVGLRGLLV